MTDTATLAPSIRALTSVNDAHIWQLADVLIDCVEGGASVSFMLPLTRDRALAFWQRVGEGVARGERALLVAEDAQGIVGTVQLVLDQPENQPHRAEVSKMLVHRRARRQGIGALLMQAEPAPSPSHEPDLPAPARRWCRVPLASRPAARRRVRRARKSNVSTAARERPSWSAGRRCGGVAT